MNAFGTSHVATSMPSSDSTTAVSNVDSVLIVGIGTSSLLITTLCTLLLAQCLDFIFYLVSLSEILTTPMLFSIDF
jgi:fructoselysine-6-P-deglycase FrlB-like protein